MTIEELREEIAKLRSSGTYSDRNSYILPALWIAEKHFPAISPDVIKTISQMLGVKPVEVEEAARFYSMFHTESKGKHIIRVCTNLSCMLNGGEEILSEICKLLNVKPGETTEDGLFTVEEFECMGLCDHAPSVTINDERFEKVTPERIPDILKEFGWKG